MRHLQQLKWQLWLMPIPAPQSQWSIDGTLRQLAHFSRLISRQQRQSIYTKLLRPDGRSHHSDEIWTAKATDSSQQSWLLIDPELKRQAFLLNPRHSQ